LPFLVNAKDVLVLAIGSDGAADEAREDVDDVASYLRCHSVPARAQVRSDVDGSVAEELVQTAQQERSDLIVAGAYGHSRLREWIFGGVTRELLRGRSVCCLLSH
jgi:nucleotide-binding universal stress UspA family protein